MIFIRWWGAGVPGLEILSPVESQSMEQSLLSSEGYGMRIQVRSIYMCGGATRCSSATCSLMISFFLEEGHTRRR
jgi:hypothetical protein